MNTIRKLLALASTCAAIALLPSAAHAQSSEQQARDVLNLLGSSTSTSSAVFFGALYAGSTLVMQREDELLKETQALEAIVLLEHYLRDNESGVLMAFALGAGCELDELAFIIGHDAPLDTPRRRALRARLPELELALARGSVGSGVSPRAASLYLILTQTIWNHSPAEVSR